MAIGDKERLVTDKELLGIVKRAVEGDEIDCADQYERFLADLAGVVADHFGGEFARTGRDIEYYVVIKSNECIPEGGGAYAGIPERTNVCG